MSTEMTTNNAQMMVLTKVMSADRFERLYTKYQGDNNCKVGDLTIMLNSWFQNRMYTVTLVDESDLDDASDEDDEEDELPVIVCLSEIYNKHHHFQINFVWVDQQFRGQGIARFVMKQLTDDGHFNDFNPITVHTTTNHPFFHQFGFVTVDKGTLVHQPTVICQPTI